MKVIKAICKEHKLDRNLVEFNLLSKTEFLKFISNNMLAQARIKLDNFNYYYVIVFKVNDNKHTIYYSCF